MPKVLPDLELTYYISSEMSGIKDFNYPRFRKVQLLLTHPLHLQVKSPHEVAQGDMSQPYQYYLKLAIEMLLSCDGMILFGEFGDSIGANLEFRIARAMNMPVYYFDDEACDFVLLRRKK